MALQKITIDTTSAELILRLAPIIKILNFIVLRSYILTKPPNLKYISYSVVSQSVYTVCATKPKLINQPTCTSCCCCLRGDENSPVVAVLPPITLLLSVGDSGITSGLDR